MRVLSILFGIRTFVWHICILPYCDESVAIRNEVCVHGKGQLVILIPAENQKT